jgi:hypothetical protein
MFFGISAAVGFSYVACLFLLLTFSVRGVYIIVVVPAALFIPAVVGVPAVAGVLLLLAFFLLLMFPTLLAPFLCWLLC